MTKQSGYATKQTGYFWTKQLGLNIKRQIRTKQFTRDVIDTLGQRLKEVIIPIPNSEELKKAISEKVHTIVNNRIQARDIIQALSDRIVL